MKVKVEIELPMLANYVRIKGTKSSIDIGELSEEDFDAFNDRVSKAFKEHWHKRKNNLINDKSKSHDRV